MQPSTRKSSLNRTDPANSSQCRASRLFVALLVLLFGQSAYATLWHCSNTDLEIQCAEGGCEVSDGFTPVRISLDGASGKMSVCAYSGCYQGLGTVMKNGRHLFFSSLGLNNNQSAEKIPFLVAIDTHKRLAVVSGLSFAMPMTCQQ